MHIVNTILLILSLAAIPGSPAISAEDTTLQQDIEAINNRWNGGELGQQQAIADSERIGAAYARFSPLSNIISSTYQEQHRQSARRAYAWLCRAGSLYGGDPLVSRALMRTYATMGDYYRQHGGIYPAGVVFGYGGANRHARYLMLDSPNSREFERDLERYAVAWAAASYVDLAARRSYTSCGDSFDQPNSRAQVRGSSLKPVPLPEVDESRLTPEQKELWKDVHNQFVPVSSRVHGAQVILEQLSDRLQSRNMKLNLQDAATAINMQGFLEDASELIKAGDFEKARIALSKSEYLRKKLKNTTGQ
jgi:hypothetical protein